MFIISLTYQVPLEEVESFLLEHIAYLDEQYVKGYFILSGRKDPRTGGIIISTVDDRSKLDEILKEDPFYKKGLASYEVMKIIPTKASEELQFLL